MKIRARRGFGLCVKHDCRGDSVPSGFTHRWQSSRLSMAIHAQVADLHLVREAAKGDDGPVLKFKRRDDAQLLHRPRQIADDEAASSAPEWFPFRQTANVAQAFGHDAQAWAKYQGPLHAGIFMGTADDFPVPWVEVPIEKQRVMPQNYQNRCQKVFAITRAVINRNNKK